MGNPITMDRHVITKNRNLFDFIRYRFCVKYTTIFILLQHITIRVLCKYCEIVGIDVTLEERGSK